MQYSLFLSCFSLFFLFMHRKCVSALRATLCRRELLVTLITDAPDRAELVLVVFFLQLKGEKSVK